MKQRPRFEYEKHSDDEDESVELFEQKPKKVQHFVEADVQDGDTLQAIALRFNCTVAALKSVNSIHRENEIFARRTLKIPIHAFSLLTEQLPAVHTSGNSSPTRPREAKILPAPPPSADLQQKLIVASVNASEVQATPRVSNDLHDRTLVDDSSPLLSSRTPPGAGVEAVVVNEFANGADFGLKWYHVVIMAGVVIIVPLIYVLYIAEHPEKYHHD